MAVPYQGCLSLVRDGYTGNFLMSYICQAQCLTGSPQLSAPYLIRILLYPILAGHIHTNFLFRIGNQLAILIKNDGSVLHSA